MRCRWFQIKVWSSSSRRQLHIQCSMIAFIVQARLRPADPARGSQVARDQAQHGFQPGPRGRAGWSALGASRAKPTGSAIVMPWQTDTV
jgi:hypothetical protein